MMPRFVCLLVALLIVPSLTLANPEPVSQDDAGRGQDAPDTEAEALLLEPGMYAGELRKDGTDYNDWYAVLVPVGRSAHLEFHSSHPDAVLMAESNDDHGWWVGGVSLDAHPAKLNVTPAGSGLVRFRFSGVLFDDEPWNWSKSIPYSFRVDVIDPADLRASVSIDAPRPLVPGADVSLEMDRVARVRLENVGLGDALALEYVVAFTGPGSARLLHEAVRPYAAGERRDLALQWDVSFEAGEAVVVAELVPLPFFQNTDRDWSNNQDRASAYAVTGTAGTGLGLDPGNFHTGLPLRLLHIDGETNRTGTRQAASSYATVFGPEATAGLAVDIQGSSLRGSVCVARLRPGVDRCLDTSLP